MKTLIIPRNTKAKKLIAKVLNLLLIISFGPVLVGGIFVYSISRRVPYEAMSTIEQAINSNVFLSTYLFTILIGGLIGVNLHELAHGAATRAFGGRVLEYGVVIDKLPGFYTLADNSVEYKRMQRVQIFAAGLEANILYSGVLLMLTGLLPGIKDSLLLAAITNITMAGINTLALKRMTDGLNILLLLIGWDPGDETSVIRRRIIKRKRRLLKNEGIVGFAKLVFSYEVLLGQFVYPMLLLLEIVGLLQGIGALIL